VDQDNFQNNYPFHPNFGDFFAPVSEYEETTSLLSNSNDANYPRDKREFY